MWQAQVFTLYPEVFPGPLSKGLYGKALSKKLWNLNIVNIRDAAEDKHKTVDDTPYGGGSGMLLKADVLAKSLDQNKIEGEKVIYLSPKGKKFDQNYAQELSNEKSVSFICGHFEGLIVLLEHLYLQILYNDKLISCYNHQRHHSLTHKYQMKS